MKAFEFKVDFNQCCFCFLNFCGFHRSFGKWYYPCGVRFGPPVLNCLVNISQIDKPHSIFVHIVTN